MAEKQVVGIISSSLGADMSLIYFHIFLISTAIVFAFGVGVWELEAYTKSHSAIDLWAGLGSFAFAILSAGYLVWFVKKKKPGMTR